MYEIAIFIIIILLIFWYFSSAKPKPVGYCKKCEFCDNCECFCDIKGKCIWGYSTNYCGLTLKELPKKCQVGMNYPDPHSCNYCECLKEDGQYSCTQKYCPKV